MPKSSWMNFSGFVDSESQIWRIVSKYLSLRLWYNSVYSSSDINFKEKKWCEKQIKYSVQFTEIVNKQVCNKHKQTFKEPVWAPSPRVSELQRINFLLCWLTSHVFGLLTSQNNFNFPLSSALQAYDSSGVSIEWNIT